MKTLVVFAACLVYAAATECGSLERLKVKSQWEAVFGSSSHQREKLGTEVWNYVFLREPKMMEPLTRVRSDNINSFDFKAHAARVFSGFDICISLLDDAPTLNAELSHLHDQHSERGIPTEYFDVFRGALLHVLSSHIEHFDQDSWAACFDVIKHGITG